MIYGGVDKVNTCIAKYGRNELRVLFGGWALPHLPSYRQGSYHPENFGSPHNYRNTFMPLIVLMR